MATAPAKAPAKAPAPAPAPKPAPAKAPTPAPKTTTTTASSAASTAAITAANKATAAANAAAAATSAATAQAKTQANQSVAYTVEQTLESYGFSGGTLSQMVTWVNQQIQEGQDAAQISLSLQQTPWFKAQFPAIDQRVKAGLPPITPAEYLSTKDSMTQTLVSAGINPTSVNLDNLIARDVSATEVSDRITQGYQAVAMAPQDVVSAFHNYYGVTRGDLAQYFLDPNTNEESLLRKATAAQIGGAAAGSGFMGATQGSGKFPVDLTLANQLAAQGVNYQQAQTGFAQLANQAQLYTPLPGQGQVRGNGGAPFTASQLAEGQFFGGPAEQALQQQALQEKNYFQQGSQVGQSGQQTGMGQLQR